MPFPPYRKLFWTDKGADTGVPPKVGSADMDGGNVRNLFTGNLASIGFIAADISARKLYWGVSGSGVVSTLRDGIKGGQSSSFTLYFCFNLHF